MRLKNTAVRGAMAGLAGALAMRVIHRIEQKALLPRGAKATEPATELVKAMAERADVPLDGVAPVLGIGVQAGAGAATGVLFGIAQARLGLPLWVSGLGLAAATWALTVPSKGALPKLGVAPPPTHQSLDKVAVGMGAHLAYGFATAAAFRKLNETG